MLTSVTQFNWYVVFNTLEAVLWWTVACVIYFRVPHKTVQQSRAVTMGAAAFFAFGLTDLLEARVQAAIPLWLWGFKCLCGVSILCARYTWLGWNRFLWTDREFLFGLFCLIAVVAMIKLQSAIYAT